MAMNDTLAAALGKLLNAERVGKEICVVAPISKMTTTILDIMKDKHYIGEYKTIDNGKGGEIEINLIGGINNCGVIKPRFAVQKDGYTKFEKRFLPALGFGFMIVSTSQGIMVQSEAREKKLGGKLIAFVY
jgi:small subunit ribosomal protein S8